MTRKIVLLVSSMDTGGAERIAANLANAWSERGDSVHLVATFSGRGDLVYQLNEKVAFYYLADRIPKTSRGLGMRLRRMLTLRLLVQEIAPDVVVSFLTNVNVATIVSTLGLPFKVAVAEHTYPLRRDIPRSWRWLRKYTYPLATRVVLLTSESQKWLEHSIPKAKGVVIPNPVQRPPHSRLIEIEPASLVPATKKLLLAVGRLIPIKGFDLLLPAFAKVAADHPDWVLAIVGEGKERASLTERARTLRIADKLFMPGVVGNIGSWYARADLYVMSSRHEGFPTTLGEAMAHGCAAVSYDCDTGPRDLIRHGVDGLLVSPPGDVSALAQALAHLMSHDAERHEMATRALEVSARYSVAATLRRWDMLFDEMARSHS